MLHRFLAAALLFRAALPLSADIALRPVTSDLDAEFARAADLLEKGERGEAAVILAEIRRRAGQRAWDARIAFLLAADDERRKDFPAAERRLRGAEAGAIGLEPYRRDLLARLLEAAGRGDEAVREWKAALDSDEDFAERARVGRDLARVLDKLRRPAEALAVLQRAAAAATGSERSAIELDRLGIALASGDRRAAGDAARLVLLQAPTADASASTTASVRAALRLEERKLGGADRARRGRALVAAGDSRRGLPLLSTPAAWPAGDRAANQLALARALVVTGRTRPAEAAAARVPPGTPEWFAATLLRADLTLARLRERAKGSPISKSPGIGAVRGMLESVAGPSAPAAVRGSAVERLLRLKADADDFDGALALARDLTRETRGTVRGFEPVWGLAWERWRAGDFAGARERFAALAATYDDIWRDRRLRYWQARSLEKEGRGREAQPLYAALAAGTPADLYALFSRARVRGPLPPPLAVRQTDPSTETADFRRTDELLRLRMFEAAAAEARALPSSRGRDVRLAEADFALGRFATAAAAAKRAFAGIGTAEEGLVPDGWRRLHYPVEEGGFLIERAREFHLDPALLRGLVRQESVFNPTASSRAGALGLTQLLPGTAKPLAKSVLRVRYRRAFLYDPGVNARLGAAFLRQLLDRFGGNARYALAAYNGGPARMQRVLVENRGRAEDEILESHPLPETRDYVRRVLLYAESYRELYPAPRPE